jgi:hypothetical protein
VLNSSLARSLSSNNSRPLQLLTHSTHLTPNLTLPFLSSSPPPLLLFALTLNSLPSSPPLSLLQEQRDISCRPSSSFASPPLGPALLFHPPSWPFSSPPLPPSPQPPANLAKPPSLLLNSPTPKPLKLFLSSYHSSFWRSPCLLPSLLLVIASPLHCLAQPARCREFPGMLAPPSLPSSSLPRASSAPCLAPLTWSCLVLLSGLILSLDRASLT